jgi:hypothetical protein
MTHGGFYPRGRKGVREGILPGAFFLETALLSPIPRAPFKKRVSLDGARNFARLRVFLAARLGGALILGKANYSPLWPMTR